MLRPTPPPLCTDLLNSLPQLRPLQGLHLGHIHTCFVEQDALATCSDKAPQGKSRTCVVVSLSLGHTGAEWWHAQGMHKGQVCNGEAIKCSAATVPQVRATGWTPASHDAVSSHTCRYGCMLKTGPGMTRKAQWTMDNGCRAHVQPLVSMILPL